MAEAAVVEEPTPEDPKAGKFRKVISSKAKSAAARAASLTKTGIKAVVTGVKAGVRETARVVSWFLAKTARGVGHVATAALWVGTFCLAVLLLVFTTVLVSVFYLMLAATKLVHFAVLIVCTPHLAMFDRELLKIYWSAYWTGVHPSKLHLTSPALGIARDNVISLFRTYAEKEDAKHEHSLVLDVEEARQMALLEENNRLAAERKARFEGAKAHPTPRQRKVRPTRIPRTA